MIGTPDISHLKSSDFKQLYEPAEDTFLLIDALEKDKEFIHSIKPSSSCGSGCVITFLGKLLGHHNAQLLATDVNPAAAAATYTTAAKNNVHVDVVRTDLVSSLLPRLSGLIDVMIFNPPYVPTSDDEVGKQDLRAAWAGGKDGRVVLDRLLPLIPLLLSPTGALYLVAMRANKPLEIVEIMESYGFTGELLLKRGAGHESLMILKFRRKS